jgi:hypothetical protein
MEPEGSYRVHKSPVLTHIVSQIQSTSSLFCVLKIHFNIILLSTPKSSGFQTKSL